MKHPYSLNIAPLPTLPPPTSRGRASQLTGQKAMNWQMVLAMLLPLMSLAGVLQAQTLNQYTTTRTTGITYNSISSTGTSFTSYRNGTSTDDNLSIAAPIGFTFSYLGQSYTQFSASTNGFLTFNVGTSSTGSGSAAYGYQNTYFSSTTPTALSLAPFYDDLQTANNALTLVDLQASMKYLTTGTAPNRVFTMEWINMQDFSSTSTANFNFQVKLYEADSHVEFVYGTFAQSASSPTTQSYSLGLNALTISTTPTVTELLTQQTANTATFNNTASNALAIVPAGNSQYAFQVLPQTYVSSIVSQAGGLLTAGATNQQVATLKVTVSGAYPGTSATQVVASTNGTVNPADLASARLYYGGASSTFSTATPFGAAVVSPSGAMTFNGSQALPAGSGDSFFFLVYNLAAGATAGDVVDAEINSITVGGTAQAPSVTAPPQKFTVMSNTPLNGSYTINNTQPTDFPTGGTNFRSFSDAVSALNNVGISGPVRFAAVDGQVFTESNLILNTVVGASASNTIQIMRDWSGSGGPTLSAAPGVNDNASTGARDAIFVLNGTDYLTLDGLTFLDPTTNTTAIAQMEYGIALLRTGSGTTLDGSNNNTIQNCFITLQRGNTTSASNSAIGIASLASTAAAFNTVLSTTGVAAAGQSSNNRFYSNTIQNVNTGIYLLGLPDTAPYANYDQGNDVGGTSSATGNIIQNFGGLVSGTTAYGIRVFSQNNLAIKYNTVQNALGAGGAIPIANTPLNGILFDGTSTNVISSINNNTIDLSQGGFAGAVVGLGTGAAGNSAVTITGNLFTYVAAASATGTMTAINVTGNVNNTGSVLINQNQFVNPGSSLIQSAGSLTFINDQANGANTASITDNVFQAINKPVTGGTVTGIGVTFTNTAANSPTGSLQVLRNTVQQVTLATATGTAFNGFSISSGSTAQPFTLTSNTVSVITGSTVSITTGSAMNAFNLVYGGPNSSFSKNIATGITGNGNINGFSVGTNFVTGLTVTDNVLGDFTTLSGNTVYGVNIGGGSGTHTYQRNKIFKLINNGVTQGSVNGFYAVGTSSTTPLTLNMFNNLVGNLQIPTSNTTGTPLAGIYLGSNIVVANVFHNTIYINNTNNSATLTAGTSTGLMVFNTAALDLRNNIVINTSTTASGNTTGKTFGFQRNGINSTANLLPTSNGNIFYVGTPSTKVLMFGDGTNSIQSFAAYKALLATQALANREFTSTAQNVAFTSTVGSAVLSDGFLHLSAGTSPAGKGGVAASTLVPKDYDVAVNGTGDTRDLVTPEIGGDENHGVTPADLVGPNIQYTALGSGPTTSSRSVPNIAITDGTGVNVSTGTAPRLYFHRKTDASTIPATNDNTTIGWKYAEAVSPSTSPYTFNINYSLLSATALPAGTVIEYFVVAQDLVATANTSLYAGPSATAPTTAPTSVSVATANLPSGTINSYTLAGSFAGTVTVGATGTYPNLTGTGGLFDAINQGVVTANTLANIVSNTTEPGTIALNALNTDPVNSAYTLTVQADPTTTPQYLLTGTGFAAGMIRLNGVRNVIIDGANSASSGTASRLLFQNTNTGVATTPTFTFQNEASYNIIRNCIIESGNASNGTTGTVFFGNGVANGIGNSYNQLIGNEIRQLNPTTNTTFTTFPGNGIYSAGLSALVPNRENVLKNNSLTGFTNAGLYIGSNSEKWTIGSAGTTASEGNRLYQIGNLTTTNITRAVQILAGSDHVIRYNSVYQQAGILTSSQSIAGFYILNTSGTNYDISYNTVGGSNASGTGAPMQLANTTASYGNIGFYVSVGTNTASSVQGNTVKNVQIATASTLTGNYFYGFQVAGGLVNFGTVAGNFVGDSTAALGIQAGAVNTVTGLYLSAPGTGSMIANNVVRNLTAASTLSTGTQLMGMNIGGSNFYTVDRNRVKEILNSAPSTTTAANSYGVYISNSNASLVVRRNKISDIRYARNGANSIITYTEGLTVTSGVVAGSLISENTLWNISSDAASNTAAEIVRALENSGSATIANNRISIPGGLSPMSGASGIIDFSTGTPNFFYNSVYLAGSSSSDSYGYYRSGITGTATLRNNIFYNERTGTGVAYALGLTAAASFTAAASNNNFLVTPSATTLANYVGATKTLGTWQQATGGDQRSYSDLPTGTPAAAVFISPATNLKINPSFYTTPSVLESLGTPVAITTDFEGQTRPGGGGTANGGGSNPDIGADEFDGTKAPVQYYVTSTVTQITSGTFPGGLNQAVVRLGISVVNASAPLNLNSLNIRLNGTTSLSDLVTLGSVKVYYTGLATALDLTTATLYGTADPASGTITVSGVQSLAAGTNYFFLTYDLAAGATINDVIDGEVTGLVLSGTTYTPTITAPAGNRVILGPMAGDYYVGTALGTEAFTILTDAFANLQGRGMSAAVRLRLTNSGSAGTNPYNTTNGEVFPLVLSAVPGNSSTNTISLLPNTGASPVISGSVAAGAVLKLNGTDYVTIDGSNNGSSSRNLTIANTTGSGSANAILWLANNSANTADGATYNTVKNAILLGSSASGTPQFGVYVGGSTAALAQNTVTANSNNTFNNLLVQKAFYGFSFQGASATVLDQGNTLTNSALGLPGTGNGLGLTGISGQFQQNMVITGNEIQNIASSNAATPVGIQLITSKTATIGQNSVHDISYQGASIYGVYGIQLRNATAAFASAHLVVNNFVYNLTALAASSSTLPGVVGIGTAFGVGDAFYFNSVSLSGTLNNTAGNISAAFANGDGNYTTATTNVDVRDNIFAISATSTAATKNYAHYTKASTYPGSTLNYNDLFVGVTGTAVGNVGYFNSTDLATLAAWKAAVAASTGGEANSLNVDPGFTSTSNLHLSNLSPLDNSGLSLAPTVTSDYDGDLRPGSASYTGVGTAPDLGADEFTPPTSDLGISALVQPAATNCYTGPQPVQVSIFNFGASAVTATAVPVRVVITPPASGAVQTLNAIYSGTAIPAGGSVNFTVGNYDASVAGTYSFAARTLYGNDANPANDALTPQSVSVTSPAAISIAASATSVCQNGLVTLTASSSDPAMTYTWTTTTGGVLNASSGASVTANPSQTATYSVTGVDGTCSTTQSITITVIPLPVVTATATPGTVCAGGSSNLLASATGTSYGVASLAYAPYPIPGTGVTAFTGTSTPITGSYDSGYFTSTLPFAFTYFGVNQAAGANFFLGTNGYISFGTGYTSSSPGTIPTVSTPNGFISGDGRDMQIANGGTISCFTVGTAPNRVFVVDYSNIVAYSATNPNSSFQIALHETTNAIDIISVSVPTSGSNHIQGIESIAGTDGFSSIPASASTTTAWSLVAAAYTFAPNTYSWSPATFLSATNIANPVASNVTATTTYTATVTNAATGCQGMAQTTITVNPRATATMANAGPIPYNTATTVSVALTGTGPWTFTYTKNGATPITVTSTSTNPYSFSTGVLASTTTYQLTALTDAVCAANTADLSATQYATTVTVVPPAIDFQPTVLVGPVASPACYSGAETVTVRVLNNGSQPIDLSATPMSVTVTVGGAVAQSLSGTPTSTATIPVGGTFDVNMSATLNMLTPGSYTFAITTVSASDPNTGNNTLSATRTVRSQPVVSLSALPGTQCLNSGPVQLTANNASEVPPLRITEVTLYSTGTGATSPYPAFVSTADDDFVEISNLAATSVDASGVIFQDWSSPTATAANRTLTLPAGTIVPANGVIVISMNVGTDNVANRYFNTGGTAQYSSGGAAGFLIKTAAGTIIDAVGTNSFVFPTVSGVTSADFSGNASSPGTYAGTIRTSANDTNTGADFTASSTTLLQTIGTYNAGYTALLPPAGYTYSYSASPNTGTFSSPTAHNPTFTPSASGTYTVTLVTTDATCSYSNSTTTASFTVNPLPTATLTNGGPIPYNTATTVNIALTGVSPWTFTYTNGTTPTTVTGTSTNPYLINTPVLANSTTYSLTALTDANCTASAAALAAATTTVTVNAPPVDYAVVTLVNPLTTTCYSNAETVTVRVRNNGTMNLDFSTDPLTLSVNVTGATTQTFSTVVNSGTLAMNATTDIVLPGTLSMTTTGGYSFAINSSSPNDLNTGNNSLTTTRTVNAPPAFTVVAGMQPTVCIGNSTTLVAQATTPGATYGVVAVPYAPQAIPATGFTTLTNASTYTSGTGDQGNFAVPLPFDFKYFDVNNAAASSLYLCTNGYASFGVGYTSDSPGSIPTTATPNGFIAGDGRDLDLSKGGSISYFTTGTAPNRTFVVYYNAVAAYSTSNPAANFQLVLHETTNVVDIISINLPSLAGIQGLENTAGTAGYSSIPASANTSAAWAMVGAAYRYTPGADAIAYNWTLVSGNGLPATTNTATISVTPTVNSVYSVMASNSSSCPVSSTVAIAATATTTWAGAATSGSLTDWYNAGNWSACVPTATINAVIPTGLANYPTIASGTAIVHDLDVQGATGLLTLAGGSLEVKGNFKTNALASYISTAGQTLFSSTAAQNIPAATYFNLAVTGTGAGAPAKVLTGDILVNNNLVLTDGLVNEGNFELRLGGTTGVVTGANTGHFVVQDGTGRMRIDNLGTGAGTRASAFFPIGASTGSYTPATLTNTGTTDYFLGSVATGISRQGTPVTSHVVNKTWDISEGVVGGSTAALTLQWNSTDELTFNRTSAAVAHYDNSQWNAQCFTCYGPAGGTDPYTLSRTGLVSFSPFGVQDNLKPLPVELTRFDAERQGANVALTWATASEKNSRGYEVQVSSDGRLFRSLGFVASATPMSTGPRAYTFLDREAGKADTRYYRLQQVDTDGSFGYSPVRAVRFDVTMALHLTATPNPFQQQLTLTVELPAGTAAAPAQLSLTDAAGRILLKQLTAVLPAGLSQLEVPGLGNLASGVYFVNLALPGQPAQHVKVVKQ